MTRLVVTCLVGIILACIEAIAARADGQNFVSSIDVSTDGDCSVINVTTAQASSVVQNASASSGKELVVTVTPLAPLEQTQETSLVPPGNSAGLSGVGVKFPDGKAELHFAFNNFVSTRVLFGQDTKHIQIKSAPQNAAGRCLAVNSEAGQPADAPPVDRFTAGKKALANGEFPRAIVIFAETVESGPVAQRAEALELLGLAYERKGDLEQARSTYEKYLGGYASMAHAAVIRDRLGALSAASNTTSSDDGSQQLSASQGKGNLELTKQVEKSDLMLNSTLKARLHERDVAPDPLAWVWTKYGSFSAFYYHDEDMTLDRTAQSQMIDSGDYFVAGENAAYKMSARASGIAQKRFSGDDSSINASVSELYAESYSKRSKMRIKLGRQSENDYGVFGRFDGALLEFSPMRRATMGLVVGSPAYTRDQNPFAGNRFFAAGGLTTAIPKLHLRGTTYAIEQEVGKIVDRRAIGSDWIYEGENLTAGVSADYDVFYEKVSSGRLDFNWHGRSDLTVYGALDYQTVPFLTTTNALIGQFSDTLAGLQNVLGQNELTVVARDRTADAITGSFGFNYNLNDSWQLAFDALVADYSGTKASGNVDQVADTGLEFYAVASATGNSIFVAGDVLGLGLRYSESDFSRYIAADAYLRYPVTRKLKLTPRIRLGWRNSKSTSLERYIVQPTLGARYKITDNWSLESELGLDWQMMTGPDVLDLRAFTGLRYEF